MPRGNCLLQTYLLYIEHGNFTFTGLCMIHIKVTIEGAYLRTSETMIVLVYGADTTCLYRTSKLPSSSSLDTRKHHEAQTSL